MNEKKEVTKGNINRKRTYQYLSTLWQNVKRKKKYILLYNHCNNSTYVD